MLALDVTSRCHNTIPQKPEKSGDFLENRTRLFLRGLSFFYPFFLCRDFCAHRGNHLVKQVLAFLSCFGVDGVYLALAEGVGGRVSSFKEVVVQLVDVACA